MNLIDKLKKPKQPEVIVKRDPKSDENSVYEWASGEEVGEIRKNITNQDNAIIAYEIKYLAGNIVQHQADQVEATKNGYVILPIWLKDAKVSCDRLVDAQKRLDELRRILEKNAISLETFTEMAKVTFNMELVSQSEKSIVEVDTQLDDLLKEKNRLEQAIYSLDIKRRVGVVGRVDYAKASLELTEAYKRSLSRIDEAKALRDSLVGTLNRLKEKEEIPQEEIDKIKARKYEIHVTL